MNRPTKNSELLQRIATYSAVAGASIAGSAPAMAEVVSVDAGVNGTYSANDDCVGQLLDLDGDTNDDFELYICDNDIGTSDIRFYSRQPPNGGDNRIAHVDCSTSSGAPYGAVNVAPGASISEATGDWDEYGVSIWQEEADADCNNFAEGEEGIVAFRLCNANGASGCESYRYGYLNVSWNRSSTIVNILGGAYETSADAPITAREFTGPTAVPVGGAIPLSIGLLALGAAALRRRRKHSGH